MNYGIEYSKEKGAKNTLVITFNGSSIEMPISNILLNSKLIRSPIRAGEDESTPREGMMDIVDQYLPNVPIESQRAIFNEFKRLEEEVHQPKPADLIKRLQSMSYRIFKLPGITPGLSRQESPLKDYVARVTEIPATVFRSMDEAPNTYKVESTYLIHEYLELVEMNIFIKLMFPLILACSNRLQSMYGKKYIIKVMEVVCIDEVKALPAYAKMRTFVEYFAQNNYDLGNEKSSGAVTERLLYSASVSSDEVVDYAFAEIITRRAVSARSMVNSESSHIVVRMYSRLSSIRDGKTSYVDKNISDDRGLAHDPHKSVSDEYRIKDKITVDHQVLLRYVVNPDYLSTHLDIPKKKLEAMLAHRPRGALPDVDALQCDIIRIATGHVITPNSLHLLTKEKMRIMLYATYLYLRQNFPDLIGLAGILSSVRLPEAHGVPLKTLDKGLQRTLLSKYPFELVFKAQVPNSGRRTSKKLKAPDFVKQTSGLYQTHYASIFPKKMTEPAMLKAFNSDGGLEPVVKINDELGTLISLI